MSVQLTSMLSGVHSRQSDSGYRSGSDSGGGSSHVAGTVVGSVIGAGVGAAAGYEYSQQQIDKLPINSVTEHWHAPVTENTSMGKIPQDYYSPGSWGWGWSTNVAQRDVSSQGYGGTVVTDANGHAEMQPQTQTWTQHGTPIVNWESKPIQSPYLDANTPFSESTVADTHQQCYTDQNGNDTSTYCHDVTDGYWHYFNPNVDYKTVSTASGSTTYQQPVVKFDTGVSVGLNTALGAVGGGLAGAAAGYLVSRALNH